MSDHPIVKSVHGRFVASGLPQPIEQDRDNVELPAKEAARTRKQRIIEHPGGIVEIEDAPPATHIARRLDIHKLKVAWQGTYEARMRKAAETFARKGTLATVEQMLAGTGIDTDMLVMIVNMSGGKKRGKTKDLYASVGQAAPVVETGDSGEGLEAAATQEMRDEPTDEGDTTGLEPVAVVGDGPDRGEAQQDEGADPDIESGAGRENAPVGDAETDPE